MFGIVYFMVFVICQVETAQLRAPTNLSAKWIDPLTVKVSWSRTEQESLPTECKIHFQYKLDGRLPNQTIRAHFSENLLSESGTEWTYGVSAMAPTCKDWKSSGHVNVTVEAPKPRAEVIDFKCFLSNSDMNCSWIPNPTFSPLSLSYRVCGVNSELLNKFEECKPYDSGPRRECRIKGDFLQKDLCMVASSPNGTRTFRGPKALRLPEKMKISEEGTDLVLAFKPLEVQMQYFYNICYSVCDKPRICLEHNVEKEKLLKIPHTKSCSYKFQYQVHSQMGSTPLSSEWSEETVHESTDWTLTVVVIVIPIILFFCVILLCVCFRRHKDALCPDVPDPSVLFKDMINGTKEMKWVLSGFSCFPHRLQCSLQLQ